MKWNTKSPRPAKLKQRVKEPTLPDGMLAMWNDPTVHNTDICIEYSITLSELRLIARHHNFPARPPMPMRVRVRARKDPSEAEIARIAEKIRKGWSEAMEADRWLGPRREEWAAPEVSDDLIA